ncbi:MAG: hypothetical protein WBD74_03080 [Candidatus Aquilonibacter sp.]
MRAGARRIALVSLCFLVALAGCGGGSAGSSGSTIPTTGGSLPQGDPTAAPSASPYPQTNGASLVYAGTLTQTFLGYPEVVAPGTPSPEPTSVTTENVTQQITIRTNQSFNGGSDLTDYHDAETDADASGLETTTSTTDTFETIAQAGSSSSLLDYGSQYADEAGDTMTTSYAPRRVEDELPETSGAQWSNGAGAQVLEAIAGNASGSPITVDRTVANSGTYSENTTYPPGYSAPGYTGVGEIQENSDGSGTYAFVANGEPITIEYSVPVPQPSGAPLITVAEFIGLDPTPADQPTQSFQLSTWYGTAPSFYNEIDRDLGTVTVPASCNLSASLPQSATAIQETTSRADTVLGYTEAEVQTSYVARGYGPLCITLQDTQTLYYDFNGDQPFIFTDTPPLEVATIAETLALQPSSASTSSTKSRATNLAGGTSTAPFAIAPALRTSFDRAVEVLRRRHSTHHVGASR